MWRRREPRPELAEIIDLLVYLGQMLMGIDAKLEVIVELMEGGDGEGN